MEQSRKKEREKKRKALLELQYADMVSNLVLLLGAGMTVSKAWNRLTENYMNERQKNGQFAEKKSMKRCSGLHLK